MNILAIDTTTKSASVALKTDTKLLEENISNEITHSEKLLPLIDKILKNSNISLKEINIYACLNGPGSFTGVRIGLSTIKGFSIVDNNNIFAINSLEAIAYACYLNNKLNNDKYIISLIDAKNDRVYYSMYKICSKDNKISSLCNINPSNDNIDNVISIISNYVLENNIYKDDILFSGDCTFKFKENIDKLFNNVIKYNIYPTSKDLINIYLNIFNKENYIFNTYTLDAMYVRPSQAERIKNEKN